MCICKYNNASIKFELETVSSNSIWLHALVMHSVYATYIIFALPDYKYLILSGFYNLPYNI